MTFYYTEPKAGNLWVFALDGGPDAPPSAGTGLVTLPGSLPQVGEPGHTLGGRVLPDTASALRRGQPGRGASPADAGRADAGRGRDRRPGAGRGKRPRRRGADLPGAVRGLPPHRQRDRDKCVPRSPLSPQEFFDMVADGIEGTNMPAFGALLSPEEIRQVRAYLLSPGLALKTR